MWNLQVAEHRLPPSLPGKINAPYSHTKPRPKNEKQRVSHPSVRHFQDWGINSESGRLCTNKDVDKLWGRKPEEVKKSPN